MLLEALSDCRLVFLGEYSYLNAYSLGKHLELEIDVCRGLAIVVNVNHTNTDENRPADRNGIIDALLRNVSTLLAGINIAPPR